MIINIFFKYRQYKYKFCSSTLYIKRNLKIIQSYDRFQKDEFTILTLKITECILFINNTVNLLFFYTK